MAAEAPAPLKPVSRDFRTGISVGVLALLIVTVGYVILWGDPDNSLHASALSWSYTLMVAILAGIGLGAVVPKAIENLTENRK